MNMLEAALTYAKRGWAVFPLHSIDANGACTCGTAACSDAGKHPRVRRGVKEATTDEAKLREWFGDGAPPSNIAIATGAVSGITVLDVDIAAGKLGAETWAELTRDAGEPDTLIARTGSGGMHVIFRYNSALKTSSNTLGKGVDCRNDNGYIVAPPSKHRSGGVYAWLDGVEKTIDGEDKTIDELPEQVTIADLPAHLSRRVENRGRPRKDDWTRRKYAPEQVAEMLEKIEADDRDLWRAVGIILGREFDRSDKAWKIYNDWSNKWTGVKGRGHDQIMHEAFYELSTQSSERDLSIGTIVHKALEEGWAPKDGQVPIEDFIFYGTGNCFIYIPTASFWVTEAVNAACSPINKDGKLVRPSDWLRKHSVATSLACDPILDEGYVPGVNIRDGVVIEQEGAATFNTYRPPTIEPGDARLASPFVQHVRLLMRHGGDADQFLDYMAHRVQRPEEKPRFALLIAGEQGVGKDTAVEFCVPAIGAWNVANVEGSDINSNFNEHAAKVLCRISEVANTQEMNKFAFNERMKVLIAGTPDHIQVNPKYGHKFSVRLHCGVILTTNHMLEGIHIPPDDRRYDVIECATKAEMGLDADAAARQHFKELWDWFEKEGGKTHVAAFLRDRDISEFSASNGQRKTAAHAAVVAENQVGDSWLVEALEDLGNPELVRADAITFKAEKNGIRFDNKVAAQMRHGLRRQGYTIVKDQNNNKRWSYGDTRTTVYAKRNLKMAPDELGKAIASLPGSF